MPLPKLKIPLFDIVIPSSQKEAKYRPFLVKEEKILLMAQTGSSKTEIINALKQIINNCIVMTDGTRLDVDTLTTFDLEYIFLKIRAKSVDNIVTLKFHDHEDDKDYEFKVSLDEIEVKTDPDHNNKIKIDDEIGVILKHPTAGLAARLSTLNLPEAETSILMIKECIDKIYDADNVYIAAEASPEELNEFVESMSVKAFEGIQKFFETMPKLYYKIEYKNSKGTDRVIELNTLEDFFTLD